MKILATLLVRDEDDIVNSNIRHHLNNGIDNFIVTDHKSKDDTPELVSYFREVTEFIQVDEDGYFQDKWVTDMARRACQYNPDWIVHLDADEFVHNIRFLENVPKDIGCVTIGTALEPTESSGVTMREFLPMRDQQESNFDYSRYRYYTTAAHKRMKGCIVAHRPDPKVVVEQGNHRVFTHWKKGWTAAITVDHYPIRSYGHFMKKVKNGGEAYHSAGEHYAPQIGHLWRKWHKKYLQGGLWEEYKKLSLDECDIEERLNSAEIFDSHVSKNSKKISSWSKIMI